MIVSIATAVLPVWRSPMMSSRWPRPTGTMASMALRPVCTGCDTLLRKITPGATRSSGDLRDALMALAVDRIAERIDHAAQELGTHGHLEDAPGGLDLGTFGNG